MINAAEQALVGDMGAGEATLGATRAACDALTEDEPDGSLNLALKHQLNRRQGTVLMHGTARHGTTRHGTAISM
jgi:hypothetical protein